LHIADVSTRFFVLPYKKETMEEEKVICPKCGNEENFHFNYDYSKKELPIIDVLCNECGEFFELENSKQK
jgi:uncharacterized Zn finger protein